MDIEEEISNLAKQEIEKRIGNATAALDAYFWHLKSADPRDEPAEHVADLIADLMHYCDKHEIDIDSMLATARMHHDAECADATLGPAEGESA